MDLLFKVINQHIQINGKFNVVSDSRNYVYAVFDFCTDDWSGLIKTAIFSLNGSKEVYQVILNDDKCLVPTEVLQEGIVVVSVFGGDLITVDKAYFRVCQSGYKEGVTPKPPTPDVYSQIIKMIEEIEHESIPPEVIEKAVQDYLDEHPIEAGVTEEECIEIVNGFFTEHKAELKGDKGDRGDAFTYEDFTEEELESLSGKDGKDGVDGKDGASGADCIVDITKAEYDALTEEEQMNGLIYNIKDVNSTKVYYDYTNGVVGTNGTFNLNMDDIANFNTFSIAFRRRGYCCASGVFLTRYVTEGLMNQNYCIQMSDFGLLKFKIDTNGLVTLVNNPFSGYDLFVDLIFSV